MFAAGLWVALAANFVSWGVSFVRCQLATQCCSRIIVPAVLALSLLTLLPSNAPAFGKKRAPVKTATAPAPVDQDYIAALAAANRFLHARQSHDQETGVLLLTDAVKNHISEDYLSAFFSSESESTYEISRGKKLDAGRYSFPVTLFEMPSNQHKWTRPRLSQIVILKTGRDDWAIDKLP